MLDFELLATPTGPATAGLFLKRLHDSGCLWHCEEDPKSVFADGRFTEEQLDILDRRMELTFDYLADPCAVALALAAVDDLPAHDTEALEFSAGTLADCGAAEVFTEARLRIEAELETRHAEAAKVAAIDFASMSDRALQNLEVALRAERRRRANRCDTCGGEMAPFHVHVCGPGGGQNLHMCSEEARELSRSLAGPAEQGPAV